ncbi:cellulose synthase complex periplasmic endoglucanase BcsZ [uncultured Oxalicibacterium sp.]|uniref:cellulose synthase complex periplasmic endoglucanase BcsZ n=1 Tax=uncultured Oxalicibacterium sp. TaxID=1168540 RepID=UPI0025D3AFF7|nr:cellulose synthase complex periplasmic endoglucanase BcsZ [uncultured Oxalicibacterium sp.]
MRLSTSRRRSLRHLAGMVAMAGGMSSMPSLAASGASCTRRWTAWENFKKNFLGPDGRVVDASLESKGTTSEGQSYALFFALLANDRQTFDRVLAWTENNLADGDLTARLPAWLWGRNKDGSWGVIDRNAASDSDLWIAYALGEAGRLWNNRRYVALSSLLASRILREETSDIPGLGLTLLPGPLGFLPTSTSWRLNPSYMPLQIMQWFVQVGHDPRWNKLLASSRRVILESAAKGFSPDWIIYEKDKGFRIDEIGDEKGEGAYNAIRVYLWAGMLHPECDDRAALLARFAPMANLVEQQGYPPESVDIRNGTFKRAGPPGFSAAMLPFLVAAGRTQALAQQKQRLAVTPIADDAYYGQVLGLFAAGWMEQRYAFARNGRLLPQWETCR